MKNKEHILQVRIDDEMNDIITSFCKKEGITKSEYMRILIDKDFFARGLIN
jgi:antitoxin component of RelBE/YafQ-DinJ toxin-antitoxin module